MNGLRVHHCSVLSQQRESVSVLVQLFIYSPRRVTLIGIPRAIS
jgi:hypothetical protein